MEPSVIATIISVTATIVVSLCGSFMWDVRTKIDKLDKKIDTKIDELDKKIDTKIDELDKKIDTKIDELDKKIDTKIDELDKKIDAKIDKLDKKVDAKIDKLDEKVNTLTASVAAIAATQAEHSTMLDHMMGHGERISALEGATFGTAAS